MNTVEVLKKARNRIIRKGWTQGVFHSAEGAYCAIGALSLANTSVNTQERAERYLAAAIGGCSVIDWNDTPGRLKGEVILAFDQAIKNAKRRHVRGD